MPPPRKRHHSGRIVAAPNYPCARSARATVYRPGLWFFIPAGTWNDFTTTNAVGSMQPGPHMAWSNSRQTLRPGEVPKWVWQNKYGYAGEIYAPRACTMRFAGCFVDNWNLRFNGAKVLSDSGGYLKQIGIALGSAGWYEFGLRCHGSNNCGAGWKSDGSAGYTLDTIYPGFGYKLDGDPSTLPTDYTYTEDAGDAEFLRYVDPTNFTAVAAPSVAGDALVTTLTITALPTNATVTAFVGGNNVGAISNLWEHAFDLGSVAPGNSSVAINLADTAGIFPAFVRFRIMTVLDVPFGEKFVEWTEPIYLLGPYPEKPDFTFTSRQTDDAPGASFTTTIETLGEGATWCDLLGVFTPAGAASITGLLGRVTAAGTYTHTYYPLAPLVNYEVKLVATNDAGGVSVKSGLPLYCQNQSLVFPTCTGTLSTYTNLTVKGTITNIGYGDTTLLLYLTPPSQAEMCVAEITATTTGEFSMPVQALTGWGATYRFRVVCSNECDGVFWTMTTATAETTIKDSTVYYRRADVPDGDWRDAALWTGGNGLNCGYPTLGSGLNLGSVAEFSAVTTRVHHAEYIEENWILCKHNSETVFLGDDPATCSMSVRMYGNDATNCTIVFDGVNFLYRDNRNGNATDSTIVACNGSAYGGTYTRCNFRCNSARKSYGAARNGTYRHCTFEDNEAQGGNGGAVGHALAYFCTFERNSATGTGGAFLGNNNNNLASNCVFIANSATNSGAASGVKFYGCLVVSNRTLGANSRTVDYGSYRNCTFIDNTTSNKAAMQGGAVNCLFSATSPTISPTATTRCTTASTARARATASPSRTASRHSIWVPTPEPPTTRRASPRPPVMQATTWAIRPTRATLPDSGASTARSTAAATNSGRCATPPC